MAPLKQDRIKAAKLVESADAAAQKHRHIPGGLALSLLPV